ncbi:MAG: M15 family metallopeptidase [Spirochaetales bacterium]|nr:M15 family metallopeptidase [Spirochaetales bacterium]
MLVDRELAAFIRSLNRIDGYNWRQIADTDTLSVHSYGTAIDLILNRTGGKQIYWLWTLNSGEKFYNVPYEKRFSPPESFIEAFEKEGFVWGGKWLFYDTIHFEYRPEIMILNGLEN